MSMKPGQSISPAASSTSPAVWVGRRGSTAEIRPSATPTSARSAGPSPMKTRAPLIRRSNVTVSPPMISPNGLWSRRTTSNFYPMLYEWVRGGHPAVASFVKHLQNSVFFGRSRTGCSQRRLWSVYFVCHGKSLSPNRALRVPDRLLRRDARDHGHPFPERGHTPGSRCTGSAGSPGPQRRDSVWHPWGYHREPDRLLDRPQSGKTIRLEVGAVCKAHPRALGATRRALRAPRRQGGLRGPFLLDLPPARSADSRHEPHALGHVPFLQRPRRGGVGYGGRLGGVLLW